MFKHQVTIAETIKDLNPAKYQAMNKSGDLDVITWEYQEQIMEVASRAATIAVRALTNPTTLESTQAMQQAASQATEIELSQILEEVTNLYQKTTS